MGISKEFGSLRDVLSYTGTPGEVIYNQFIFEGRGIKRLDGLQASYLNVTPTDTSPLLAGRIVVAEGQLKDPTQFIDVGDAITSESGLTKIHLDLDTVGDSHRIISLGNLGIIAEEGRTLSVIQWPIYGSADFPGTISPAVGKLNVQGQVMTDLNDPLKQFKLKLR